MPGGLERQKEQRPPPAERQHNYRHCRAGDQIETPIVRLDDVADNWVDQLHGDHPGDHPGCRACRSLSQHVGQSEKRQRRSRHDYHKGK